MKGRKVEKPSESPLVFLIAVAVITSLYSSAHHSQSSFRCYLVYVRNIIWHHNLIQKYCAFGKSLCTWATVRCSAVVMRLVISIEVAVEACCHMTYHSIQSLNSSWSAIPLKYLIVSFSFHSLWFVHLRNVSTSSEKAIQMFLGIFQQSAAVLNRCIYCLLYNGLQGVDGTQVWCFNNLFNRIWKHNSQYTISQDGIKNNKVFVLFIGVPLTTLLHASWEAAIVKIQ
jgi:hypothetical protein